MTDLDKAREWADRIRNASDNGHPIDADCYSAAEVIQSLPDRWVDAEKLREAVDKYEGIAAISVIIQDFAALLTPKLPTLADMTQEEREACQWMQCEIDGQIAGILARVDEQRGHIWIDSGYSLGWKLENVTPLPDLPKLQWPGYGVVHAEIVDEPEDTCSGSIHTPMQPSEVPADELWLVSTPFADGVGYRLPEQSNPWFVIYPNLAERTWGVRADSEITLIHKLVPETHALPEGMRLADHEEYGRVVVSPKDDLDGDYRVFCSQDQTEYGADWWYAHKSDLTFLDGDQHV